MCCGRVLGHQDGKIPHVDGPDGITPNDAPALWSFLPSVDIFAVSIQKTVGAPARPLVPRLHIGARDQMIAIAVQDNAADQMLGRPAIIQIAAKLVAQGGNAPLLSQIAIVKDDVICEHVADGIPVLRIDHAGKAGQLVQDFSA
mgnify:CR=1 FL=1